MKAMEKNNFVLRENISSMEAKLQESLMKNLLLEEKIYEINSKHNDFEQYIVEGGCGEVKEVIYGIVQVENKIYIEMIKLWFLY